MKKIAYNADLMDEISSDYTKCAEAVQDIIDAHNNAKTLLLTNYRAQGEDIADDSFKKIREHLELLKECCAQTAKYVTYTKESAQEQDKTLAK